MARRSSTSRARYLAGWADKKRAELIAKLGGKCALKGDGKCNGEIEFHHPFGRDWKLEDFSRWQRVIKYRRESDLGLIELRCRYHNRRDSYQQQDSFDPSRF